MSFLIVSVALTPLVAFGYFVDALRAERKAGR